jgi:hypothetical protein
MVDINLFKEEDEEEWKSPPDEGGEDVEGVLGEDLDLGGEETDAESPSFEDEKFLSDEDAIPDFEEPEERELEEDYEYGDSRARGAPVWLWALLGAVVVAAAFYLFYLQPRQKAKSQMQTVTLRKSPADSLAPGLQRQSAQAVATGADSSTTLGDQRSGEAAVSRDAVSTTNVPSSTILFVNAATAVFDNLSSQGQLGTIVFEGGKFHVGYVSSTPGVAQTMGQRVQRLIGASAVRVSPEDRHSTAGKIQYWGVVSGDLPSGGAAVPQASTTRFNSADGFVAGIRGLGTENRMTFQQTEKFSIQSEGRRRKAPVRMKIEGARANAINFLNALKGFQGNYDLTKLTIAPVNISDYTASQVKLVLDFTVWIG